MSPAVLHDDVTSARISDTLDALGCRQQVMSAELIPLRWGMRASGPAATIEFGPALSAAPEHPYDDVIEFIDSLEPGEIAVIAAHGDVSTALWGELFSAAARGRGAAGVVCDGYLRDSPGVIARGFAAFSRGTRPIDVRGRMEVISTRAPVVCAGVQVTPGDLVLADDDGIVVIPAVREEETLQLAGQRAGTEVTVLEELEGGASLRSVWDRYGVL